jgi:diguanylate cyclase (GGDEF)-like protein
MDDIPYSLVRSGDISSDTAAAYVAFYERIIRGQKEGSVWYQSRLNGRWEWLESRFSTFFSNDGKPISAVVSLRKITEEVEHEAIYKKWVQSLDERPGSSYTLLRCSLRRNASFDLVEGSLLARAFPVPDAVAWDERIHEYANEFVSPVDYDEFLATLSPNGLLSSYRSGKRTIVVEYREVKPGGAERWMRLTVEVVAYPSSRYIAAYLLFEDIDEQKRANLQTQALAATDPLTGLLNRCAFEQAVRDCDETCDEHVLCALLMIDLDRFKQINDTFGHMAGDKALVEVAQKLKGSLRRDDLICRFGGDEFMVFICGLASRDEIGKKAGQLCALLQRPLNDKNRLSVSIGIAVGPDDGRDFDGLYRKADRALYHVKDGGKNAYMFYDKDMENSDQPGRAAGGGGGKTPFDEFF